MSTMLTHALLHLIKERGMADDAALEKVQEENMRSGKAVTALLHEMNVLDTASQLDLMAEYMGTEVISLDDISFTPELLAAIPAATAQMYQCLPVGIYANAIRLVLADPLNPTQLDDLAYQLGKEIQIVITDPARIIQLIDKFYSDEDSFEDIIKELGGHHLQKAEGEEDDNSPAAVEEVGDATPITRFVNLCLYQAVKSKAADIHFEPFEDDYRIRMKVDGTMVELTPPPRELASAIASRIKIMANLNIAERRLPQDGRIATTVAGLHIDLRVSCLPTRFGESVVLRVLDRNSNLLSLEILNIPKHVYDGIIHCIEQPSGIFAVTGPTGSGKTTTLYAALRRLNQEDTKIVTAEDPVEFDIEGLIQVPMSEAAGMTFAKALKAFLRQDPDIIMIGEMRDLETASIGIQASLTGHLVVSTLHTNNATEAITRLLDMGVEPFLIVSSLNGVLAQRLSKTICPRCRAAFEPTESQIKMLELSPHDVAGKSFHYGTGCDTCNKTGYKGRRGIYELLMMSDPIRALISERAPGIVLREKAREFGMQTLRDNGLSLMYEGTTTFEEVMRCT
ncbi:MAG: type II/IV secretion system protein [Pedosphaera sp.]|nr:type II/IV secretion system protein [Pedosphaera sp.]MST00247.1 type II/IV secretion system protein [Pedosphaera sp.]